MCVGVSEGVTYPAESNTTVFADRTGVGAIVEGGRGDAERSCFLVEVGDLWWARDSEPHMIKVGQAKVQKKLNLMADS